MGQWAELTAETGVVIPLVKKRLMQKSHEPRQKRVPAIYPSELARDEWCSRATYWRLTGKPEPQRNESFTLSSVFAEGNAIHEKWQGWLKQDLWGDWRCPQCGEQIKWSPYPDFCPSCCVPQHDWEYREVPLESPDLRIRGRADGALLSSGTLIEFKSVGLGTLRREAPKLLAAHTHELNSRSVVDIEGIWKSIKRPLLSHEKQVNLYLHMAGINHLPFDQASVVYEFKANQQAKEWVLKISPKILSPMLDAAARVVYAVEHQAPPACVRGYGCAECRPWEGK